MPRFNHGIISGTFLVFVLGASGCGTVQPPVASLSQAELALQEAHQRQASQHAPLELRKAREKLEEAKAQSKLENYSIAQRLAEEALVDAQLAEAKAEAEIARRNARELQETINALRGEMRRQIGG